MRILIFSNWLPPTPSGSSYYASSLAHALAERRHEVAVVTLDWGQDPGTLSGFPFPVYRLPVIRFPRLAFFYHLKLMGLSFTPGNVRRLESIVLKYRPQIIHHVNHIFDSTFLSSQVGRKTGVPVVGSITTPIQHQNWLKQRLMTWCDRWTVGFWGVRRWDAVVSLDGTVHRYVGDLYGKKVQEHSFVIPFGVRIESMKQYYECRPEQISGPPQIVFVGHIHPFRNPVQLIRAMPMILKAVPEARLVLAGRIDLKEPVRVAAELNLSPRQVSFLGETEHSEVVRLMRASHIFVSWVTGPYPSLGTAPMEAMLCGIPVVNDFPENLFGENKLKNGGNILLVNSRDPKSIADGIIRLCRDPGLRESIGMAGRKFVEEHLNWDGIARQMEDLYGRVLTKRMGKTSV